MLKKLDPLVFLIAVPLFGCDGRDPIVPGSDSESAGSLIDSTLVIVAMEYKELGRNHFMAGRPDSALLHFDQAIEAYAEAMDTTGLAGAWFERSRALVMMRDRPGSIAAGKRSIALRSTLRNDTTNHLARALANVGMAYSEMGMPDSAMYHLLLADSVMRARRAPAFDRALVQNSLSAACLQLDDFGRMLDHALSATALLYDSLTIFPPHVLPANVHATGELNLCLALSGLGMKREAAHHGERCMALLDEVLVSAEGRDRLIGQFTRYKASNAMFVLRDEQNDPAGMMSYAGQALSLAQNVFGPAQADVAIAYSLVAFAQAELGDMSTAVLYSDSAVKLVDAFQNDAAFRASEYFPKLGVAVALHGLYQATLGDVESAQRHFDRAIAMHEEAVRHGPEPDAVGNDVAGERIHGIRVLAIRALGSRRLYETHGNREWLDRSIASYDHVLTMVNELYSSSDLSNRSVGGGLLWGIFTEAVATIIVSMEHDGWRPHAGRLMAYMEATRNARSERNRASWLAALPHEAQRHVRTLAVAERQLAHHRSALNESQSGISADSLASHRRDVDSLRLAFQSAYPHIFRSLHERASPEVFTLQKNLVPQHAVVTFLQARDRLFITWLTSDTLMAWETKVSSDELHDTVSEFLNTLEQGPEARTDGNGNDLYALLLERGIAVTAPTRITVIPDGSLWRLPFEALPMGSAERTDGLTECVLDRITVNYAPDASMLEPDRYDRNVRKAHDMTAFAPIVFGHGGEDENRWIAEHGGSPSLAFHAIDLPGTEEEVLACREVAGGRHYFREAASKEQVRKHVANSRVLHFATHAVVDDVRPERSALYLWGESDGKRASEPLTATELQLLDMDAELVVLSACATGVGQYQRGEGVLSLARAFHHAGAHNVVTTLWRVEDQASREIMTTFYWNLTQGKGKADALAEAKRTYARAYPSAPVAHWAAFVLVGDNEPVTFGQVGWSWLVYIALVAIFLICTSIVIRIFRRAHRT